MKNSVDDILMTCDFCGKKERFGEMNQVCLRQLTTEEIEDFKKVGRSPLALEFAMRCNKCKEKGKLQTLDGYTIDTEPVKIIPYEKTIEMAVDKELNKMYREIFGKKRG